MVQLQVIFSEFSQTERTPNTDVSDRTLERYRLEVVKDLVYIGTAINSDNDTSAEIKRRITLWAKKATDKQSPLSNNQGDPLQDLNRPSPAIWRRSMDFEREKNSSGDFRSRLNRW